MAPRKVRAVAHLIKGKKASEAFSQLDYFVRRPARPLKKLLDSAIANAENNFNMIRDNLYIKAITVDEGVKLKRFRAKGFGRAAAIQKKTSHIRLILDELTPGLRHEKTAKKKTEMTEELDKEAKIHADKKSASGEARQGRPEIKREIGKRSNVLGNLGKRLFQRKAV